MPVEKLFSGNPSLIFVAMTAMAALPFFLMSITCYVKLSVVFGILRNAIGGQQIPSTAITSLLALVLTAHIMHPIMMEMKREAFGDSQELPGMSELTFQKVSTLWGKAQAPLLRFLVRHSGDKERVYFLTDSEEVITVPECPEETPYCLLPQEGFFSLIPAFVITELREAFAFGFLLFLPFLVIDLVVSNILVGLGLNMLSPITLTLPLKILLFAAADSWLRISQALISGYQ